MIAAENKEIPSVRRDVTATESRTRARCRQPSAGCCRHSTANWNCFMVSIAASPASSETVFQSSCKARSRRGRIPANYDECGAGSCVYRVPLLQNPGYRGCVFPVGYCWLLLVTAAIPIMHYFASLRLHNVQAMISQTHELASCTRPGHTGLPSQ